MNVTKIKTAVDHDDILQGDVVIIKHAFLDGKTLKTKCSSCGEHFDTQYRRMGKLGTSRGMEVRNVPQCVKCRGKYKKATPPRQPGELRVGDRVRCIDPSNPPVPLIKDATYTVSAVSRTEWDPYRSDKVTLAELPEWDLATYAWRFEVLS